MIVEYRHPRNVTGLGTEPEPLGSAAPRPDREHDREHLPPRCACSEACGYVATVPYLGQWWAPEHAPGDALRAQHVPRVGEAPRATAGMISARLVVGMQEDGRRAEGAGSWEWRPPLPQPIRGHDEMALASAHGITSGGIMGYQPAPPSHPHIGAPGTVRDVRRHVRMLTETQAERINRDETYATIRLDAAHMTHSEIADALGLTDSQLRRKRHGRSLRSGR